MGSTPRASEGRPGVYFRGKHMRRRLLPRLGLALVSAVVALGAVEAFLRFTLPDAYRVWPPNFARTFEPEHAPGIEGVSRFTTNALGFRGDPYPDDERYRILAIGGSTTICGYLDDAEAWPYRLQEDLNAALGSGATWVGNAGRVGLSTPHHRLQVEKLLPQHPELDAVILLIGINDFVTHLTLLHRDHGKAPRPARADASRALLAQSFSAFPGGDGEARWYRRTGIGRLWTTSRWPALPWPYNEAALDTAAESVARWRRYRTEASRIHDELPDLSRALGNYARRANAIADAAEARGVRAIFVTQPTLWRANLAQAERELLWMGGPPPQAMRSGAEYYSVDALAQGMEMYNEKLRQVCRERGVECIDAAALIPKDASVFYDDAHFTEEGSRQLAALVAARLLENAPLRETRVPRR